MWCSTSEGGGICRWSQFWVFYMMFLDLFLSFKITRHLSKLITAIKYLNGKRIEKILVLFIICCSPKIPLSMCCIPHNLANSSTEWEYKMYHSTMFGELYWWNININLKCPKFWYHDFLCCKTNCPDDWVYILSLNFLIKSSNSKYLILKCRICQIQWNRHT